MGPSPYREFLYCHYEEFGEGCGILTSMASSSSNNLQWSIEVPSTSRSPDHPSGGRGNIRRSCDPLASPVLGAFGVRTLYEALRRGRDINPLGPCLGFRATR